MIDSSVNCRICGAQKRCDMKLFHTPLGTLHELYGVYINDVEDKRRQGYEVTSVYCGDCGVMYHHDAI